MQFSDKSYTLRMEIDAGNIVIAPGEREKMDNDLSTLRKLVANFPARELKIELSNQTPGVIRVGACLRLAGRTLFAAGEAGTLHAAWDCAVRRLIDKVRAFKDQLGRLPERQKEAEGTLHELVPIMPPDAAALDRAVNHLDYRAFRASMNVYEDALEKRVGRWIERYPDAEARLGDGLLISEVVEEVLLNAFDQFRSRPASLRLGQWLENLIDPSLQTLLRDRGNEKENLSFIATAKDAGT
jgi:ribosome-associated translation inhibitor RaiA